MSTRELVLLGFALAIIATPLEAQTFFHVGGADRTGMAVEVQRGVVAGVVVSQPEGRATSTATFAGSLLTERTGGVDPFTTTLVQTASVQLTVVPGSTSEPALFRRSVGIGMDTIEFQRPGRTLVLEPFDFGSAGDLDAWAGRYVFLRSNADGLVDATQLSFTTRAELDGRPALIGTASDGRAGLLLLDAATGVLAGAYEPKAGQPVALALLGKYLTGEHSEGVWVTVGADGSWVGGDHALHLQRLAVPAGFSKSRVSSVAQELRIQAQRALSAATARDSLNSRKEDLP